MATEGDGNQDGQGVDATGETERDIKPENGASAVQPDPFSRARATPELAGRIAAYLAEPHATVVGACAKAGILYRKYKRWMADDAEDGSDLAGFQLVMMEALERERVKEVETLEEEFGRLGGPTVAKAGALVNKFNLLHFRRFQRIYGEDETAKKTALELTGKDGGPVESSTTVRYVVHVPQEEAED